MGYTPHILVVTLAEQGPLAVGGKFTTHRRMAEAVADHVCAKFGIDRECETGTEPLPGGGETPPLETFPTNSPIAEWSGN